MWCNDGSTNLHAAIVHNLCAAAGVSCSNDDAHGADAATAQERAMLRVAAWEAQAQVVRLDGMRRDVWQWDVPESVEGGQESGSSSNVGDGDFMGLRSLEHSASGANPSPRSAVEVEDEGASGRGPQLQASMRRLRVSHMDANRCAKKLSSAYQLVMACMQWKDWCTVWDYVEGRTNAEGRRMWAVRCFLHRLWSCCVHRKAGHD